MNVAASISVYFALQATIRYSRVSIRNRRLLKRINLSVLVFFLGLTFWQNNFEIFKIHAATGVLIIFLTYFCLDPQPGGQRSHRTYLPAVYRYCFSSILSS